MTKNETSDSRRGLLASADANPQTFIHAPDCDFRVAHEFEKANS